MLATTRCWLLAYLRPLGYSSTAPMYIIGYDKAIAEANGFTIVVDPDGTQHSVPVTKKAQAQA